MKVSPRQAQFAPTGSSLVVGMVLECYMRSGFILVIATFACFTLAQAHAVEAPEGPVLPVPQSPTAAAATPYPQVSTQAVLTGSPLTDSQPALPPIQVPTPPAREAASAPDAAADAGKSKPPGG